MEPRIIRGENWVNDKLEQCVMVQAKTISNDKSVFDVTIEPEGLKRTSDIMDVYMVHRVGHHPDYGNDSYWEVAPEGSRGASLFYYSTYSWLE